MKVFINPGHAAKWQARSGGGQRRKQACAESDVAAGWSVTLQRSISSTLA